MSRARAEDVGLGEVLAVLRRRANVLAYVMVPILVLAAIALFLITPRYTAEALIMIESSGGNRIVSLDSVVAGLSGDEESVQSEAYILASRALAERVVQRLSLDVDPELGSSDPDEQGSSEQFNATIDLFMDRLDIAPLENSRVIAVRFSAADAEISADIANTIADEYLEARLESKFAATRRANTWIQERIAELRVQVAESEVEVERLRGEYGLLEGDGMTFVSRELLELNSQLVVSRSEYAEAVSRLEEIEKVLRTPNGAETLIEVMSSPTIQKYREQEAEVERRVAELSVELGDKHPRMIQLRAEAENLRARIALEVEKIISGLRNKARAAQARQESLQSRVDLMKQSATVANRNAIELRAVEREAEASRDLLDTLLAREQETVSQEDVDFQQPDAKIVSLAATPTKPSWPRSTVVLGIAFIGSLILSMLVMLTLEMLDGGFRSGEQFEAVTGAPSIGFIPFATKPEEYESLPQFIVGRPASALGESLRTINWSVKLAFPDDDPRIVLVSSSLPGEGKTTIAGCMSVAVSRPDQRVLLIDADLRRPSCHELLGVEGSPGLTNVLAGAVKLEDALQTTKLSGLTFLPAGAPSQHAPELLSSRKMESLLEDMTKEFDLIVIDSPPVLVASDALILSRLADATVLVVRWGSTKRPVVSHSVRQFERAGAKLAGGLLSMVDVKRNANYGYGDSAAYGDELARYYTG